MLERVLRPQELTQRVERANIRAAAAHLRQGSRVLEARIAAGSLVIAGAEQCLESGVVGLFDGVPDPARQPGGAGA